MIENKKYVIEPIPSYRVGWNDCLKAINPQNCRFLMRIEVG